MKRPWRDQIRDLLMRLAFAIPISGALFWIAYNLPDK